MELESDNEYISQERKNISASQSQELGQQADLASLASDCLFTFAQPIMREFNLLTQLLIKVNI